MNSRIAIALIGCLALGGGLWATGVIGSAGKPAAKLPVPTTPSPAIPPPAPAAAQAELVPPSNPSTALVPTTPPSLPSNGAPAEGGQGSQGDKDDEQTPVKDQAWHAARSQELKARIAQLKGASVTSIDCGAAGCQLTMSVPNEAASKRMFAMMEEPAPRDFNWLAPSSVVWQSAKATDGGTWEMKALFQY